MHEPLPREFRTSDAPSGALALVWACTLAVIVAVACVGVVSFASELRGAGRQTALSQTASAACAAASSTGCLVSGMPQP